MIAQSCFIIAEAGVNHNGSLQMALDLVDVAAAAGADAVKFQTFRAESLIKPGAAKASYQRQHTGDGDQFSMLKPLELDRAAHEKLRDRCQARAIEFMSTPFDDESLALLLELGMRIVKVPSGELTNHPYLKRLASTGLPLIVSTGMATLDEVREAVEVIKLSQEKCGTSSGRSPLTLLHCTSNYPAPLSEANLRAMTTLAETFKVPVGYSDHTEGTVVGPAAVAMGAVVVEKHFTLSRDLPGPDHKASLVPEELKRMISDIRAVEEALGDGVKAPKSSELAVRDVARRSLTLKSALSKGETIEQGDLVVLRPGHGIAPKHVDEIVGMRAARDLSAWTTLVWEDLLK